MKFQGVVMSKSINQKLKLLYIRELFLQKTDEDNGLTIKDIINYLKSMGIESERKSLYADIEILKSYGMDIVGEKKGRSYIYKLLSRDFEIAELKLLIDSVQSSKLITTKKSDELIKKIKKLTSIYQSQELQRQVYVLDRIKTPNENVYYNVDTIYSSINSNTMINFKYYDWNLEKKFVERHNGKIYEISPWSLSWDNENYYLIGYDSEFKQIRHYRVDKIRSIKTTNKKRLGKEEFDNLDIATYTNKVFSMVSAKWENVAIRFDNSLIGVIIDRFGTNINITKKEKDYFEVNVEVATSMKFFAWIIALGDKAKILSPENVVEQFKNEIKKISIQYNI